MNATTEIKIVPLHKLHLSPLNVRKTRPKGSPSIEELAANIKAHGVIHNLVVVPEDKDGKRGLGVVVGGRRWTALTLLLKRKEVPKDYPVAIKQITKDVAASISLSENVQREAMHPADEFEAWAALVDAGKTAEDIAAVHGVTPAVVDRRLRLARVSPKVMDAYRKDKINLDQVMAFTLTTDHKRQEALLRKNGDAPYAHQIKAHLTEKTVRSNECRALLIGREAYEAAGGVVREDMFSENGTAYYEDPALLDRLVADVLEVEADKLRKKYPWVEVIHGEIGYSERSGYGTVPTILGEPTPKAKRKLEPLREQLAAVQKTVQELDDASGEELSDEDEAAFEAKWQAASVEERKLERQIEAIEATLRVPDPEAQAIAGAVIGITSSGKIERLHNRIRPQDKAKVKRAAAAKTDANGHAEAPAAKDAGDPQPVRTDLTTFATAVAQEALADNVGVALRVLALQLMDRWGHGYRGTPYGCKVSAEDHANLPPSEALDGSGLEQRRRARQAQWEATVPLDDEAATWEWLQKADDATVLQLLAYSTARSLAGTRFQHERGDSPALALLQVLGVDLRQHWTPDAGYFRRIKKATTLEILAAHGHADPALAKAKRDPLAERAEALLAASGWLPPSLTATEPA